MPRIIETLDDIADGIVALAAADPRLAEIHRRVGLPPLRRSAGGLEGLAWIIVSQQVSTASAAAIWARTRSVLSPLTAEALLAAPDESFHAAGLSRPKVRTLRALAQAIRDGLDLDALADAEADQVHAALTAVTGIGPWTADVYLMICLGHADAFAAGDLALQEAARFVLNLSERPDAKALAAHAEAWRPWRGVAARLLWAYYRAMRAGREGAPVEVEESR